ncbi:MAG: hypothetical protein JNK29_09660 [Anaerolineales bacterium]|nr:hypothetical protein [Anaerolineales bacterium]
MLFQVNDQVVHSTHGVGRVVQVVTKRFATAEARRYYEIAIDRNTVWVPVEAEAETVTELRLLTPRAELGRYRAVLQSQPAPLTPDHRQRRLEISQRLKNCSLQTVCEIVRDLSARGWQKPLNDVDATGLRRAQETLGREWAAAEGVSLAVALQEIEALLLAGRQHHQPRQK